MVDTAPGSSAGPQTTSRNADGLNRCYGFPELVKKAGPNLWYLSPNIQCERHSETSPPANALVTWNDEAQLAYPKRRQESTYLIGDAAFCTVDEYQGNVVREYQEVAHIKKLEPQLPVPETIYTGKDENRFLQISRRIPGESLQTAWLGLTDTQRENIADQVAQSAHTLAKHTSPTIQDALGGPTPIGLLFIPQKNMSPDEIQAHFWPIPDSKGPFILSHESLVPEHIIIKDGQLAGIIGWGGLRYVPRWWLTTAMIASVVYSFDPELYETERENNALGSLLSKKLYDLGYPHECRAW